MASVLLDHNVPRGVRRILAAHDVRTTREMGWDALTNGELLSAAEAAGFAVLVTADRNIRHQQNLAPRTLALVVLGTNVWPVLRGEGERIAEAVARAGPGRAPTPRWRSARLHARGAVRRGARPRDAGEAAHPKCGRSAGAPRQGRSWSASKGWAAAPFTGRRQNMRDRPPRARAIRRWSGGPKRTRVQAKPSRA